MNQCKHSETDEKKNFNLKILIEKKMSKTIFRFLFWSVAVDRKTAITSNSEQVVASYFECNKWTKLFFSKKDEKRAMNERKKWFSEFAQQRKFYPTVLADETCIFPLEMLIKNSRQMKFRRVDYFASFPLELGENKSHS